MKDFSLAVAPSNMASNLIKPGELPDEHVEEASLTVPLLYPDQERMIDQLRPQYGGSHYSRTNLRHERLRCCCWRHSPEYG